MFVGKVLAVAIILLFVGVSVVPSTGRILDKLSIESSNDTIIYVDDDNTEGHGMGQKNIPIDLLYRESILPTRVIQCLYLVDFMGGLQLLLINKFF